MDAHDYTATLSTIPRRRDQLLPALHAAHEVAGWLPQAAIEAVARHVFVPNSEVYGIVTGYSELRLSPPEPERVEVCTGLSCRIAGADEVLTSLEAAGRHVERVPCRFLCGVAPVNEFQQHYTGRATSGAAPVSHAGPGVRRPPRPSATGASSAFTLPGTLTDRRMAAVERQQTLAARIRITISEGACGHATSVGDRALDSAFTAGVFADSAGPWLVHTGCGGDCHAQPVVTVRRPDGTEARFERVTEPQAMRQVAGAVRGPTPPAPDSRLPTPTPRRVLRNCGVIDPESLDEALAAGAYLGLERALAMNPADMLDLVRAAGLRGRGGAYFPTHLKWESALGYPAPRYVVVNAEEGEPGVFKDRHLMEGDPHAVIEGTLIAAYVVGAERAFIYVNGQAALSAERLAKALEDAGALGLTGENVLGSGFSCEIALYRGAGGYVCGEESVLLNSIEGERPVPRVRPPLPVEAGLWGRPTVINNVETLVNLPLILTEGPEWFRSVGTEPFPGTKLICLSGAISRPGLVEVPLGTTVREIIETWGGGALPGHTITAAVLGGPSGGLMPASMLDVPIAGGMLHPSGPVLGAGGIVVLDERMPVAEAVRDLTAYNKVESCGKCTPCREGTARALDILDRSGGALSAEDQDELLVLCDVLQTASLCGLGQMAPGPIRSALTLFARESRVANRES
jgi:NADH:ubiquinone oxidoreductase subunit F (NADH-binding)/NADH:ubiquinone oxidoreductase subunit E